MYFATASFIVLLNLFPNPFNDRAKIEYRKDVFLSGQNGYHTYRIPALVMTNNEALLAFCEGRKQSASDEGDIDLLLKRSEDRGVSWSEQVVVYEEGGDAPITIGNPCPIVERNSTRIHLLFTRNNKRLFYTCSTDDGMTWSKPAEFTHILDNSDYPIVRIATGPVHGIEMKNGRLIAPIWASDRERKDRNVDSKKNRYRSGTIYSDDHGKTWIMSKLVPATVNRLNEATVVERDDGSLLLNMRAHQIGFRAISTSFDAGATWSDPVLEEHLIGPTCQGSMAKYHDNNLLFVNPASKKREQLTLKISQDSGKSWTSSLIINTGPSAYSDIAVAKDESIYCLFENGSEKYTEKISIVRITLE